jgi:hypothetical protein
MDVVKKLIALLLLAGLLVVSSVGCGTGTPTTKPPAAGGGGDTKK